MKDSKSIFTELIRSIERSRSELIRLIRDQEKQAVSRAEGRLERLEQEICKSCITDCWNEEDKKRVYSCPQCRQTFRPRPALFKNVVFAEMLEKLKKTKLQSAVPAGAGDVQCDVCTGRKYKAVKSCLVCLNSYCQNHLEQHESFFKGKRHNLTEVTGRLQEMICQKHEKLLEVFCRTDQKCICVMCMMDEHQNHNTVSAAAQRTEKQVFNTSH